MRLKGLQLQQSSLIWIRSRPQLRWPGLLLAGLIARIVLSLYGTYQIDFNTWRAWGNTLSEFGFARFYQNTWCDYLPGYLYVLRVLDGLHDRFPTLPEEILYKLPANLADLGLAVLIFWVLQPLTSRKTAQLISLAYFFNPAILANSTFWGQIDSVHALLILVCVLLGMAESFILSGIFAALSFLVKPQSITIVPVLGFFLLRFSLRQPAEQRWQRGLIRGTSMAIAMALTAWLLILPFIGERLTPGLGLLTEPFAFLQERFAAAYDQYTFASFNAFNFWGTVAMRQNDQTVVAGLTYQRWGTLLFAGSYSFIMGFLALPELRQFVSQSAPWPTAKLNRSLMNRVIDAVTLILFALFLWITRAHERHFLPAIVLLTLTTYRSSQYRWMYGIVSGIYVLNMIYAYTKTLSDYAPLWIDPWIPALFAVQLGIFALLLLGFIRRSLVWRSEAS